MSGAAASPACSTGRALGSVAAAARHSAALAAVSSAACTSVLWGPWCACPPFKAASSVCTAGAVASSAAAAWLAVAHAAKARTADACKEGRSAGHILCSLHSMQMMTASRCLQRKATFTRELMVYIPT